MSLITVPTIKDGETTLNAAGLGAITNALTSRTEELYALCGDKQTNAVVITDAGLTNILPGTIVYYDTDASVYRAAEPGSAVDADGRILPGAAAYVAGMVLSVNSDGIGQLLVNGVIAKDTVSTLDNLNNGPCFLGTEGSLVNSPEDGKLAIYCGFITNTGWFIFNPASPPPTVTAQTIAPPVASIIPGPGIGAEVNTRELTISGATVYVPGRTVTLTAALSGATVATPGTGVAAISGGTVITDSVVNTVSGGLGIDVSSSAGNVEITATGLSPYIDFQVINANNVLIGNRVDDSMITFPAHVSGACVVGTARLPKHITSGAKIFAWVSGVSEELTVTGSVYYSSGGQIKTIDVTGTIPGGGANNTISELVTDDLGVSGDQGNGLIEVVLKPTNAPTDAIHVIAAGVLVD